MKAKKGNLKLVAPKTTMSSKSKVETKAKKVKNPKTLVIAREIKFARLLASNDRKVRDKVLRNLKKWLSVRSKSSFAFTDNDFTRLWKGLFYCMWMSDKPLVQEELAESLSQIIHCFESRETALLYIKCTLKSLASEWFGIDRYRVDKFEMLLRKILRQIFMTCKRNMWDNEWVVGIAKIIEEFLLDPGTCLGLSLHLTEIYMEELAKVSDSQTSETVVTEFVRPYAIHLAAINDVRQIRHVMKNIFRYLIFQSDVGMEYMDKFEAWKQAGFPCKNIEDLEKLEDDEDDLSDEEQSQPEETSPKKILDPRAGKVDVELPQLRFDPHEIAALLMKYKFQAASTTKTRRQITRLIKEFTDLADKKMPIGIKEVVVPKARKSNVANKRAAERLLEFEDELLVDSFKRKRGKSGKNSLANGDFQTSSEDESENKRSRQRRLKESSDTETDEEVASPKVKSLRKDKSPEKKTSPKAEAVTNARQDIQKSKFRKRHSIACVNDVAPAPTKSRRRHSLLFIESDAEPETANDSYSTCNNWDVKEVDSEVSTSIVTDTVVTKTCEKVVITENVTPKKISNNHGKIPWLTPVLTRLEEEKHTPAKGTEKIVRSESSTKKRVVIMLQRNTEQHTSEYIRQLRRSPAIPFDANKKPAAGVLKASPLPSPLNPFYKRKIL